MGREGGKKGEREKSFFWRIFQIVQGWKAKRVNAMLIMCVHMYVHIYLYIRINVIMQISKHSNSTINL